MPRKVRELESELRREGFLLRSGKGSHRNWYVADHPDIRVTLSGQPGQDAQPYQEREVRDAIAELRKRREAERERTV